MFSSDKDSLSIDKGDIGVFLEYYSLLVVYFAFGLIL
jgi:hypothetical protein